MFFQELDGLAAEVGAMEWGFIEFFGTM